MVRTDLQSATNYQMIYIRIMRSKKISLKRKVIYCVIRDYHISVASIRYY